MRLLADASIAALRTKSIALTSYLVQLADVWLASLGFTLASPRDPARRGSHVALHHDGAYRISQALIEIAKVVPDYRTPNRLRLGLPPATTSYTDIHHAMRWLTDLVKDRSHLQITIHRRAVTCEPWLCSQNSIASELHAVGKPHRRPVYVQAVPPGHEAGLDTKNVRNLPAIRVRTAGRAASGDDRRDQGSGQNSPRAGCRGRDSRVDR